MPPVSRLWFEVGGHLQAVSALSRHRERPVPTVGGWVTPEQV
jgi:hypothetical protein